MFQSDNSKTESFRLAAEPPSFDLIEDLKTVWREWRKVVGHLKAQRQGLQPNDPSI